MCTVLPPGVNPIAVNKYISLYIYISLQSTHKCGKVFSPTHRPPHPPPPKKNLGTHFCYRQSRPVLKGHSDAGRITSVKNSSDTNRNRTRDLPACNAVYIQYIFYRFYVKCLRNMCTYLYMWPTGYALYVCRVKSVLYADLYTFVAMVKCIAVKKIRNCCTCKCALVMYNWTS